MATETKKLDRRVVRTRKAIMDAFVHLLEKVPLNKVTVSAIAREADIDRKTFYLHYKSVEDLVVVVLESSLDRIVSAVKTQGAGKSPAELVHIGLVEVNAMYMEHLDVYEKIASTLSVQMLFDQFNEVATFCLDHLGIDRSVIEDDEMRMRAQFCLAGGLSLYASWLQSDHSTPIETVSDAIEGALNAQELAVFQVV